MTAQKTTSAPLIINLFGPMQLLVDSHPLPHLRSRKGLWLMALLTLRHGRSVEREWLAGTLWPDMEQSQAFANLRPILSELRNALGSQHERLQSPDRHTLLLNLTEAEADVPAFDAAIKSGKLADLERAVALYRGTLLEGCNEEWVFQERNIREQNCLQALLKLADCALTAGDYGNAVGYYQRAAMLDPWGDAARRGWMEALTKSGDRNAALQVYREFVEVLRDDPNAVPDAQTSALYSRLRAEAKALDRSHAVVVAVEPIAAPKISGYLPHPMTDLIGREDERLEVSTRLRYTRLLTLTGLGGIGKTRLALDVAREVSREYADGVWLVALDSLTEGKQVIPQIASVMEVKEEAGCSLLESVTRCLKSKRTLLVLDNCEHLLGASAQVAGHLLRECGELRILATSREALEITGETVWAVPSLATPDPAHLPQGKATLLRVLMSYESVQLFIERAQAVQKNFDLTGSNARSVAEVCYRLEGIPLALELAAARIKSMTVEQIAARLDNELNLLTGGSRIAQSRQQTLRAMLDWSYVLLTEPERILLRRLSVFVGGWTLEAAEAVCSEGEGTGETREIHPQEVLNLLNSLVDKSLVTFEDREQSGGGRYRLLEIVRQYAAEKLQASGEIETLKIKHRDWFVALSEKAEPELRGAGQKVWIERLVTEYDNLRAAMIFGSKEEGGIEAGLRLTGALWRFWYIRGAYIEGYRRLEEALAKDVAQLPTKARAKALHGTGIMLYRQGEYRAAKEYHLKALDIREQIGDRQGMGDSLLNLGNVAHDLGEQDSAKAFYDQSLQIRRELGDKHGIAMTLGNLGNWALNRADLAEAKSLYTESLHLYQEVEDKFHIAWTLNSLCTIASMQGDYRAVHNYLEESLPVFEELGERRGTAWSLHRLACMDHDHRRYEAAQVRHQEILAIFTEIGDKRGMACSFHELGMAAIDQNEIKAARHWLTDSWHLFQEIGDSIGIAYCVKDLGLLALREGNLVSAKTSLDEGLRRFRELDEKKGIIESLEGYAAWMLELSKMEGAARLLGAAHCLRENLGLPASPNRQAKLALLLEQARVALGEDAFAVAWEEGRALNWEQAIEFALAEKKAE